MGAPLRRPISPLKAALLGAALLVALLLDAITKGPGNLQQMLWSCHWASTVMALGMFLRWDRAVTAAFLFHVAVGFPAWTLGFILTGVMYPTSVLVHIAPLTAGALYMRRVGRLPQHILPAAWAMFLVPLPVAAWFTSPALNINLAHSPWPGTEHLFPRLWLFHLVVNALVLLALAAGYAALTRWYARAGFEAEPVGAGRSQPPVSGRTDRSHPRSPYC